MNSIKKLEELLKNDVLVEINENIKELEAASKDKNVKAQLSYMLNVKKYFDEVLLDIENNSITENEAIDILEGLEDMRVDNQQL